MGDDVVLIDTSVWVDHLRTGNAPLRRLLGDAQVLLHPAVIGEIACGSLRNRREILHLLHALPQAEVSSESEVLQLVESRKLYGRGIGWVDSQLVASALLTRATFWTYDKALRRVARSLGIADA